MVDKKSYIVVGLGYGDEGKGLTTDYLCSINKNPIVIRFNGGHQAGHCVVLKSGLKHVFSNFGSGTLRNIPTYWSQYCTVEPLGLISEYNVLRKHNPQIYIDLNCQITTHYDILYNRAIEKTLGNKKLGSCGVGYGATVDRCQNEHLSFRFEDLLDQKTFKNKLRQIRDYYKPKFNIDTAFDFNDFAHDETDILFLNSVSIIKQLIYKGIVIPVNEREIFSDIVPWQTYIFEGAQGILLDKDFGRKPHITKSNTTSRNAFEILKRYNFPKKNIEIYYVTRAYQTRHGAGPFKSLIVDFVLKNNSRESNVYNDFQGEFKKNYLDLDDINFALQCDSKFSNNIFKSIMITCLDHLYTDEIIYYENGSLNSVNYINLHEKLLCDFKSINYSSGNRCENVFKHVKTIH